MREFALKTLLLGLFLFGSAPFPALATDETKLSTRDLRCRDMQARLELARHRNPKGVDEDVERLATAGRQMCSRGKQAQGIRALATAVEKLER